MHFYEKLNADAPPSIKTLGGHIAGFDENTGVLEFHFEAATAHTHSDGIVQGGFVAGMLDAAMAHVVFCVRQKLLILATLEMKVSYLDIARPGPLRAFGRVIRLGKSIGFLEAELLNSQGALLAKASSTVKIVDREPPHISQS